MQPQNGIVGDITGTELPIMEQQADQLAEERKMAKYSKTTEFKRIQDHFRERIEFYQKYLPNGTPIEGVPMAELAQNWAVANAIIKELNSVIDGYYLAAEVVKDANK